MVLPFGGSLETKSLHHESLIHLQKRAGRPRSLILQSMVLPFGGSLETKSLHHESLIHLFTYTSGRDAHAPLAQGMLSLLGFRLVWPSVLFGCFRRSLGLSGSL